jgi:hypothetical protein
MRPHEPVGAFRVLSRETAIATLVAAVLVLAFQWPIIRDWKNWGIEDWDYWAFHHEAARASLIDYAQFPHWNPWYCGGTDLAAHPGSRVFSPSALLSVALGATLGLKLEILLHALGGLVGLWALCRQLGMDFRSASLAPCFYFLGPFYALPVAAGMMWFTSLAFLPWAFLFFLRALAGDRRALVASSASLALMYFGGGAYPLVITGMFLAAHALLAARAHGMVRCAATLGALFALTASLSAVKLLPSIEFAIDFPRHSERPTGFSIEGLGVALFSRDQRLEVAATRFDGIHAGELLRGISADYDDVGMYVGPVVAILFAIGLLTKWKSRGRLALLFAFFLALSLGNRLPFSPFLLLQRLPVIEAMRFAERYRFVWLMCGLIFAGWGVQHLSGRLRQSRWGERFGHAALTGLIVALLCDLYVVTRPIVDSAFPIRPMHFRPAPDFRQIIGLPNYDADGFVPPPYGQTRIYGSWSAHYPAFLMNRGFVRCYESAAVPRAPLPMRSPRYRGEAHLEGTAGAAEDAGWSPNRLRFSVHAESEGRLVINQNYYRGWRASDGRPVEDVRGLLSVGVGPGDREIELRYRRATFLASAALSIASWAAALVAVYALRGKSGGPASREFSGTAP